MALLNQPLQIQSSFPQIAQQYAAINERRNREDETYQRQAEAQRKSAAREQGAITAGVEGLQSYPALYNIAQGLYNDYNKAEASGDVEQAEAIKGQLGKFIDGAAAFSRSEQNIYNAITTDPEQLKKFNNSIDDINSILDNRRNKQYELKREGNSYSVVDGDGNTFNLFGMPELAGNSFVVDLDQKATIPGYLNASSFGESRASAILSNNKVTDENGNIINKNEITNILKEDFRVKLAQKPEFLDGIIYDYQKSKGDMDMYDQSEIDRLKSYVDPETKKPFIETVKEQYISNAAETVSRYARPKVKEDKEDKLDVSIKEIPIVGNTADFSKYGSSLRFFNKDGGLTTINQIKINPSGGLTTRQPVQQGTDAAGNPIFKEVDVNITRGSDEWNRLSAALGGDKYLLQLLKRIDPSNAM